MKMFMKLTFLLLIAASALALSLDDTAASETSLDDTAASESSLDDTAANGRCQMPLCKCAAGYEVYYWINPLTGCRQCTCCPPPPPCAIRCAKGFELYYPIDPRTHCPGQCRCRRIREVIAFPDEEPVIEPATPI